MSDVFVGYKREDREAAERIVRALERQGWSVWWDTSLLAGERFDDVIERELTEARCVVVLWSKRSVRSHWVREEAAEGREREALVPVLLERGVRPPIGFRTVHAAVLAGWSGDDGAAVFQGLVASIVRILGPSPAEVAREKAEAERRAEAQRRAREQARRETKDRDSDADRPSERSRVVEVTGDRERAYADDTPATKLRRMEATEFRPAMVLVPGGTYWIGSPEDEEGRRSHEVRHEVTLSPYWIATTPVTQSQYMAVMGKNPSYHTGGGVDCPVDLVTWFDAVRYCNALSAKESGWVACYELHQPEPEKPGFFARLAGKKETPRNPVVSWRHGGTGYRLPTEAEWEVAARAGTSTRFWSGDSESDLEAVGWYRENSGRKTHPVASKPANPWGLHDVHGNVYEWVWDWYASYELGNPHDPKGPDEPPSDAWRVIRGGSAWYVADRARAACRNHWYPWSWNGDLGFRVLLPRAPEPSGVDLGS